MTWLEFGLNLRIFSGTMLTIREWRRVSDMPDIEVKFSEDIGTPTITLYHIEGAIYVYAIGLGLGVVAFLAEFAIGKCKKRST